MRKLFKNIKGKLIDFSNSWIGLITFIVLAVILFNYLKNIFFLLLLIIFKLEL